MPAATRALWKDATGIELIDGIGATEMMHIFISHDDTDARPGATGKPVAGYRACVMDDAGHPLPAGKVGRLAVKGPTGCRYLADDRQLQYVQHGWNVVDGLGPPRTHRADRSSSGPSRPAAAPGRWAGGRRP